MPRSQVEVELARAEADHAGEPERAEMLARVRRFKASWYELGEALVAQKRSQRFKSWGYASFEEYCRRELHLRTDTVDKLTGSYSFLRERAPDALARDGRAAPIPSYQAVDFWRRAEEAEAPEETVQEIRRQVLDEGVSLPKLSRIYREVVFPISTEEKDKKERTQVVQAIERLIELLAAAKEQEWIPLELAAEVEEPLQRITLHLRPQ